MVQVFVQEEIIPASPKLREAWTGLTAALDAAAKPFVDRGKFPISPFYAYDLVGGDEEAGRQLKAFPSGAQHQYSTDKDGDLFHTIRWT